jgi:integrase/recombinase XerD
MASVSIVLKREKSKPNGECPLFIRLTKNRTSAFISLDIWVKEEMWDEKNKRLKSKYLNSARANNHIALMLSRVQSKMLELSDPTIPISEVKQALIAKKSDSFLDYFQGYLDGLDSVEHYNTHRKSVSMLNKLKFFLKGKTLFFGGLTVEFLKIYVKHLQGIGNSNNTIHSNLKVFKMLCNKAVKEGVIEMQNNPFTRYSFKWENVEKVFLTEDEITAIRQVSIKTGSVMEVHQDMFVFASYTGGIRVSDLLTLRWEDFDGINLSIFVQKTKSHLSIKVPNIALDIIAKYRNENQTRGYIFPVLDEGLNTAANNVLKQQISAKTALINKNLKIITAKANISKRVTAHTSRHTFGTLALKKGMNIAHVSKLMSHTNLSTTMIYAKIVNKDLDDAMELFN